MTPFPQAQVELHSGETLYFFTDGFADQFGGEKGKKFMSKRFLIDLQIHTHLDCKSLRITTSCSAVVQVFPMLMGFIF
ncbi:MAG: serine phosphatase RsbU (regulator of sigma subunit) [Granulosicoccus sp.]|jgi:serine phosphatase RsbU (regulator of sigma subunit)